MANAMHLRIAAALFLTVTGTAAAQDGQRAGKDLRAQEVQSDCAATRQLLTSYLRQGLLREVVQAGEGAIMRCPADWRMAHLLGLGYFQTGQLTKAEQQLQRAAELASDPDLEYDLGLVLLQQQRYADAAVHLEKAIASRPRSPMSHLLLGRAYQNSNRTLEAVAEFKTALRLQPKLALGHYHLGFSYEAMGRSQEALAEYEREQTANPNPEVLFRLGRLQLELGNARAAVQSLRRALEKAPGRADAQYELGKALATLGDLAEAHTALLRAAELNPTDPGPHYQLARVLQQLGKGEQARDHRQRFVELSRKQQQAGGMASGRVP